MFFNKMALRKFVKSNRPGQGNVKPSPAVLAVYSDVLPSALLELWKRHGFGFYGKNQFRLINPEDWQAVLDRWIVSSDGDVKRIPIALTPFGTLVYYRRITDEDEDIAIIDPIERRGDVLNYDLVDFFNKDMSNTEFVDGLLNTSLVDASKKSAGPLAVDEVYVVDQSLISIPVLLAKKKNAQSFHAMLRAEVDKEMAPNPPGPASILKAIPKEHVRAVSNPSLRTDGVLGLYLSVYIDWYKLITLKADGRFELLFWKIDRFGETTDVRKYSGPFEHKKSKLGDEVLSLDIRLNKESLGSDANDDLLHVCISDESTFLFQTQDLPDIAINIMENAKLGRGDSYFQKINLTDPLPVPDLDGVAAPAVSDLPIALQDQVNTEPKVATILEVGEFDGETIMVTLDLGEDDGLIMNMPMSSPKETSKSLRGWVWKMHPTSCGVGVSINDESSGDRPEVGDKLETPSLR